MVFFIRQSLIFFDFLFTFTDMESGLNYIPLKGLETCPFGSSRARAEEIFGNAQEVTLPDAADEDWLQVLILHYPAKGLSLLFKPQGNHEFFGVENTGHDLIINGEPLGGKPEAEIIEWLIAHGYKGMERTVEDDGEVRITSDEAGIDFFFERGKLSAFYAEAPIS